MLILKLSLYPNRIKEYKHYGRPIKKCYENRSRNRLKRITFWTFMDQMKISLKGAHWDKYASIKKKCNFWSPIKLNNLLPMDSHHWKFNFIMYYTIRKRFATPRGLFFTNLDSPLWMIPNERRPKCRLKILTLYIETLA